MSNENYARPTSLSEAIRLLSETHSTVLGGGTYLVRGHQPPDQQLLDLGGLGLNFLIDEPASVRCGATVTLQELIESNLIGECFGPVVIEAARVTRPSWMLRNMSTLGGELVERSRHSAIAVAMLALDAKVTIATVEGNRRFRLDEFYGASPAELTSPLILNEVSLPKREAGERSVFRHLAQLPSREPIAVTAISLFLDGSTIRRVRIALGSAVIKPQRLYNLEQKLIGSSVEIHEDRWPDLCASGLSVEFASDHQHSAEYLRDMSEVLIKRAYLELLDSDG
jgi:CO/xanthine dehydrogenase FAD-binding subunit